MGKRQACRPARLMAAPNGGVIMAKAGHRSPPTGVPDTAAGVHRSDNCLWAGNDTGRESALRSRWNRVCSWGANVGENCKFLEPHSHQCSRFLGRGTAKPRDSRSCACTTLASCRDGLNSQSAHISQGLPFEKMENQMKSAQEHCESMRGADGDLINGQGIDQEENARCCLSIYDKEQEMGLRDA